MKIKFFAAFILIICLAASLIACAPSSGDGETDTEEWTDTPPMELADADDLSFTVLSDNSGCAVLGLFSESGAIRIEIPAEHNGMPVVAIAEDAFSSNVHLESITIPDTVTHIGSSAFDGCVKLKSVELSKNLEFIGEGVFDGCSKLSLTEYNNAFYLGSESSPYTILMNAKNSEIEHCELHPDTRIINEFAFADCTEVDNIIIPNGIKYIGTDAFYDCYDLEFEEYEYAYYLGNETNPYLVLVDVMARSTSISYTVHDKTKIIVPAAFYECKELTTVKIPESVECIGAYAFEGCDKLLKVEFPSISDWRLIKSDDIYLVYIVDTSDAEVTVNMFTKGYIPCTWAKQ